MMGKKNIYDVDEEKATEYWMSFSDMMASLLLVFILFLTMTMYQVSLQEELLSDKEDEVNKIIGVRKMIVEELKEEFRNSELQIDIDPETGEITFSEGFNLMVIVIDISTFQGVFRCFFMNRFYAA